MLQNVMITNFTTFELGRWNQQGSVKLKILIAPPQPSSTSPRSFTQIRVYREAAKILVLQSGKIDEYEYLTCTERLLSNQKQILEQA